MPLGDVVGEVLGGAFRVIGRFLFEIVFEGLIKGTGYVVIRFFRPKSEPEETMCGIVGLGVFGGLLVLGVLVYAYVPRG